MNYLKGSSIAVVLMLCVGVVLAAPLPKVKICHKGIGIEISLNALAAHVAHGDTLGPCGTVCACQPSIDPVTCSNGRTYINECTATCDGATNCSRVCACQPEIDPILCADGNTYINPCVATCAGATGCSRICACQPSLDPVRCSSNDGTYINACVATCDGATGCVPACNSCPAGGNTVLCTTGNLYNNQCQGRCAGEAQCYYIDNRVICDPAVVFPPGSCPGFSPVICPNGASYASQCVADACLHGETTGCTSACLFGCNVFPSPVPVTCTNGTTYVNACYADCDGATGCIP